MIASNSVKESFNEYADQIFAFFDHSPTIHKHLFTEAYSSEGIWLTNNPPHSVYVVFE